MYIQELLTWEQFDDEHLSFLKAIGVDCVCLDIRRVYRVDPALDPRDGRDRTDFFEAARGKVESHGMRLHTIFMEGWREIALGAPDRDEKIEAWCTMLWGVGAAGIPVLGYNFKPMGNFRTPSTKGRGGASYSTFDYEVFAQNRPKPHEPPASEAEMWGHMEYFLKRVIPVAKEAGVRMALHPDDPPIPEALGGVAQIASTLEQFRRIFGAVPSDSNGMMFCQGCMTELLGTNVYDAIRELGSKNQIVYVHFRNVRGRLPRFEEVFIDEGDVDMFRAMQIYKEVGFNGPFMMDHTPRLPQQGAGWAGQAYAVGYIRGLIQAVYR